jgi:hypothetical protein
MPDSCEIIPFRAPCESNRGFLVYFRSPLGEYMTMLVLPRASDCIIEAGDQRDRLRALLVARAGLGRRDGLDVQDLTLRG